jgi:predicted RNA-binding Zn-ribbon protein involved in translation (DUF1610 family)
MNDLQTFAAAVLASWRADGKSDGPIPVSDFLDRVFPYAIARRKLGIDVSEDYEALALRLLAEEGGFAEVTPADAAELARVTVSEKLPDLAVLQLLRGARINIKVDAAPAPKPGPTPKVVSIPQSAVEEKWQNASRGDVAKPAASAMTDASRCWSCGEALPAGRSVKFCPQCGADQRPPSCQHCNEPLEREWKHCPECGVKVEKPASTSA